MSFPKQIFLTMAAIGAAGSYPLHLWGTPEVVKAAVAGGVIATANVLGGYAAIARSTGKPMAFFMKWVLGGMGIRLFAMAALLVVLTRFFGFHTTALVASLGVFYISYLTLEVIFIQKHLNVRQSG